MYQYYAYGLNISSDFPLPELLTSEKGEDLYISKGIIKPPKLNPTSIFRQGKEAFFCSQEDSDYLHWSEVSNFRVKGADKLIVEPLKKGLDSSLLNLYILSEALGIVLHQKGFFLLHGSAVKLGEKIAVFIGNPGAGKSTIAGAFAKQDYTVIADDMVAISIDKNHNFCVIPAFPQIKLWSSAIEGLEYQKANLSPLFLGSKKQVFREFKNFPQNPLPLKVIYILDKSESLNITKIKAQEALLNLTRFFPLPSALLKGKSLQDHFQKCIKISQQIPIYKLNIPRNFLILKELVKMLTE